MFESTGRPTPKRLAAVGVAALTLVKAEATLLDKKITTAKGSEYANEMTALKAKYTGKDVEKDKKIVTTTGFDKKVMRSFLSTFCRKTRG